MDHPNCPFCQTSLVVKPLPGLEQHFRHYVCEACHCEVKQPLSVKPEQREEVIKPKGGHEDCPECAFGDVHCCQCDDLLCTRHVRTFEKYSDYFSKDLAEELQEKYGRRVYCPLCFQMTIQRFSALPRTPRKPPGGTFNFPVILGLLSVFLIIMIGLRRCDSAKLLMEEPPKVEQTESTP